MYEWSQNLQANLLTAFDLFEKVTLLPAVLKKPKLFQATLRKDLAACVMNLGNVQMDTCKEKILSKEKSSFCMFFTSSSTLDMFLADMHIF